MNKATYTIDTSRTHYNPLDGRWYFATREGLRGPFITQAVMQASLDELHRTGTPRARAALRAH